MNTPSQHTKERVIVILTPQLTQRLDKQADKLTMSRSLLIRLACEEYLKGLEQKKAA